MPLQLMLSYKFTNTELLEKRIRKNKKEKSLKKMIKHTLSIMKYEHYIDKLSFLSINDLEKKIIYPCFLFFFTRVSFRLLLPFLSPCFNKNE